MLIIFDENFPKKFVDGFSKIESANKHNPIQVDIIHALEFMEKQGALDTEIISKASKREAIIVTHDSDFKRIKSYKPLLIEHQVAFIYFKTPKQYKYWDMVKSFINNWDELKGMVSDYEYPFAIEVGKTGKPQRLSF